MKEVILTAKGISGGYIPTINILHGIDISVERGEAIGILGLNGSGKSSLGKALVNLLPYRNGVIEYNGNDISRHTTEEISREGVRMMFQGGQVFQTLSVWDNLRLVMGKDFHERMRLLRSVIPILDNSETWLKTTMADRLSGGQRHQLALAMTLSSMPNAVILDEPSAGLSPKSVEMMYNLLHTVRERFDLTIILIEQNIAKAVGFCDRCLVIQQGTVGEQFVQGELRAIEDVMFNIIAK